MLHTASYSQRECVQYQTQLKKNSDLTTQHSLDGNCSHALKGSNYHDAKSFLFLIGINCTFITFVPKTFSLQICMISRTLDSIIENLFSNCFRALQIAFNLLLWLFMKLTQYLPWSIGHPYS